MSINKNFNAGWETLEQRYSVFGLERIRELNDNLKCRYGDMYTDNNSFYILTVLKISG